MVTLSLCVDLISLKIACDFVMNSVHYSKNTSSEGMLPIPDASMCFGHCKPYSQCSSVRMDFQKQKKEGRLFASILKHFISTER